MRPSERRLQPMRGRPRRKRRRPPDKTTSYLADHLLHSAQPRLLHPSPPSFHPARWLRPSIRARRRGRPPERRSPSQLQTRRRRTPAPPPNLCVPAAALQHPLRVAQRKAAPPPSLLRAGRRAPLTSCLRCLHGDLHLARLICSVLATASLHPSRQVGVVEPCSLPRLRRFLNSQGRCSEPRASPLTPRAPASGLASPWALL